jgi:hypothetical protein
MGLKRWMQIFVLFFSSSPPIPNRRTEPITCIILAKIRRRKCTFLPHTNGITGEWVGNRRRPTGGSTLYSISMYVLHATCACPCPFLVRSAFGSARKMLHLKGCLISWFRKEGGGGAERKITLLEDSHVSPARPSANGSIKWRHYNSEKGHEILMC